MAALPTPQQLRYLVTLAELRHFGRAAAACAVTQSTLSAGILSLERQLAMTLLDRGEKRRVAFTAAGTEAVSRARRALLALEAVAEIGRDAQAPVTGPLRLGMIPTVGPFVMPRLVPAIADAFPGLRLSLREDVTERLLRGLKAGRLDAVLLAMPCDCAGFETLPLFRDEMLVALPPGHRLAVLDPVPLAALTGETMLLLEDGHCLRDQVLSLCRQQGDWTGREGDERFAATGLHTLIQMVQAGLGVTLLPSLAVRAGLADGSMVLRPVAGTGAWRSVGLAWRPRSARAEEFRRLASVLSERLDPGRVDTVDT